MSDATVPTHRERNERAAELTHRVLAEVFDAQSRHRPFASAHEAYAVLLEEVDELWDEVKSDNLERARAEAVQVAAMAIRFLVDVDDATISTTSEEA